MKLRVMAGVALAALFWAGAAYALVANTYPAGNQQETQAVETATGQEMTARQQSMLLLAFGLLGIAGLGRLRNAGRPAA